MKSERQPHLKWGEKRSHMLTLNGVGVSKVFQLFVEPVSQVHR